MSIASEQKISSAQNLEGRIIRLETDYTHLDRRLNKIDKAIEEISADVKIISGNISQQIGANNAKKTGWKVVGYIVTILITLGAHHFVLKIWDINI